ncbi:hypothetical protein C8035_v009909 [Colletotrichum spinosum]|uniref:Uncharacterized protein n=1 Tax=Colletotrichum spinosum TaxID=1347390 RepID=A0A4R8QI64_9PEZI|nr:hypothetical protein C8035_v009909 [Colletotrichum spinosum]
MEEKKDTPVCRVVWSLTNKTADVANTRGEARHVAREEVQYQGHTPNFAILSSASDHNGNFGHDLKYDPVTTGYPPYTTRRILEPVSRLRRADLDVNKHQVGEITLAGCDFPSSDADLTCGPAKPGDNASASTSSSARHITFFPDAKVPRLANQKTARLDIDGCDFRGDVSPKHYLALAVKATATADQEMPFELRSTDEEPEGQHDKILPRCPLFTETAPTSLSWADNDFMHQDPKKQPGGSSSIRSAQPVLGNLLALATLRRQRHPPARGGKRDRSEYENTTSIAGRDIALEKEIWARFMASSLNNDGANESNEAEEKEEEEEGDDGDDEDDEDDEDDDLNEETPASK